MRSLGSRKKHGWIFLQDGPNRRDHLDPALRLHAEFEYPLVLFLDRVRIDGRSGARFRWVKASTSNDRLQYKLPLTFTWRRAICGRTSLFEGYWRLLVTERFEFTPDIQLHMQPAKDRDNSINVMGSLPAMLRSGRGRQNKTEQGQCATPACAHAAEA